MSCNKIYRVNYYIDGEEREYTVMVRNYEEAITLIYEIENVSYSYIDISIVSIEYIGIA